MQQNTISFTAFNRAVNVKPLHVLVLLIVVGTFIRFHNLTYTGLWLDEITSMKGAAPNLTVSDVYENSKNDQPPLFYLTLYGWLKIFGNTDFAGRALACVFGILCIPAVYFLGKELKDERVGLFAAFITTINWFHTDVSKEVRFYPLVFLLSALSYLFFIRSVKRSENISLERLGLFGALIITVNWFRADIYEDTRLFPIAFLITALGFLLFLWLSKRSGAANLLLYSVFTSLLLNAHFFGLVVFLSQIILFILSVAFFKRSGKLFLGMLAALLVAGSTILHWSSPIQNYFRFRAFHVRPVSYKFPVKFAMEYFYDPVAFFLFLACAGFAIWDLSKRIKTKTFAFEDLVLQGWILLGFIFPIIYTMIRIPILLPRYCIITLPAIILVISYGFMLIRNLKVKLVCISLLSVSAVVMLFFVAPPYKPVWAEDWREVAAYFSREKSENQVVFSKLAWYHEFYFQQYGVPVPIDQRTPDFNDLINNSQKIWLLQHPKYRNGDTLRGFSPEQLQLIEAKFDLEKRIQFPNNEALLYLRQEDK